ncbi:MULTISPECIES: bifunctional metallophosphatase/5'-nucleotidase [Brachybacterium]|uniref:Bifunctional metallophosphatase/5'-nucleotidase n=2 Tax=Brachybacterium TaxID=43668 RepID=A0A426SK20_9MICO|nr:MULTISPECIES: bifunctional UDP-sugar hydrolase/5'-nucleotidase [Brachybacterium]RRR18581.1 bifunctional metallophosphatase/5'-nucleotidase [Brachybacterium paraconglomeratum]GLI30125.1 bifunctional metallophosphatase/5'-nucleotidase [Brachybacterium conglomeratum]GLK04663.1 bifunctional metallophosphatase/5'-nucleotidase [Brachybacterium conglomeratum]
MRVHPARSAVRGATVGLGAAALAVSGALVPLGAVAAEPGQQITLMGFNDFHGALGGASALACQVETVRAESDTSFLFSAGDNVGGSAFESAVQNDEPTIDVLNALGVDATAIGNHEYDQGQDDLFERIEPRTEFADLAANVYDAEGERVHDAFTIVERDGVRVAVIGAVTTKTVGKVSPAAIEGLEFGDPVDAVNDVMDELETDGVEYDAAVALYHEGASGSGEPGAAPSNSDPIFEKIVSETDPEVDAIFNGDSHRTYAYLAPVPGQDGETRPILQTGSSAANLGTVTLQRGEGEDTDWDVAVEPALRPTGEECTTSTDVTTEVTSIAQAAIDEAAVVGAEPVGSIAGDITTSWDDSKASYTDGVRVANDPVTNQATTKGDNRFRHSAAGNMLADSMKWYLEDAGLDGKNEVIGFMNPGGIRAELWDASSPTGEGDGVVTYAEANGMVPFGNTLNSGEVSGAQFLQMLEEQWQRTADGGGVDEGDESFLAFSVSENVEYAFDSSAPQDERVFDVRVNGEPIDPEGTYTIVTASFLFEGGDNMWALSEAQDVRDTGVLDRDAFISYLEANPELEPDYSQRQIDVQFLEGDDERSPTLRLSGLESQSLGAPEITSVTVDAGEYGTFEAPYGPVEAAADGEQPSTMAAEGGLAAEVTLTDWYCEVPADTPEGTVVPLTITAVPETGTEIVFDTYTEITGGAPEGCDDDGSTTPPPGDGDDGGDTTTPPPGDDEDDDQGSDDDQGAGDDQGSDDQGSDDQGADDQGADDQGADDQGADDQGSDDQGSEDGQGTSTGGSTGAGASSGSSTTGDPVGDAPTTADGRSDLARTGTNAGVLAAIAGALTLTGAGAIALRHRVGRR